MPFCVCVCVSVCVFLTHSYDLLWALGTNFKYIYCRLMWQLGYCLINGFMTTFSIKTLWDTIISTWLKREEASATYCTIKTSAICIFLLFCLLSVIIVIAHIIEVALCQSETTEAVKRSPFAIS